MSTKVKSDGTVEIAMLKLVGDLTYDKMGVAKAVTKDNLRQMRLKGISKFKETYVERFGGIVDNVNERVIALLDEYIQIRLKQSPNYRQKAVDYDILFGGPAPKPTPMLMMAKRGEAKPDAELENETVRELLSNSQKYMQIYDAGGQKSIDYWAGLFEQCGIGIDHAKSAANVVHDKLSRRMSNIRESQRKRFDVILKKLGNIADR